MSEELDQKQFDQMIEKNATKFVTFRWLGVLVEGWRAMNAKNVERNARLDALEQRIAQLEAQPRGLSYAGTWQRERAYGKDSGTTHHGSLWVAIRATASEPGTDDSGWQLVAKRGRDGRDARS